MKISKQDYKRLRHPRYGTANPEKIENPLWDEMLRRYWSPNDVRKQFEDEKELTAKMDEAEAVRRLDYPLSSDREGKDAPVWGSDRTGSTRTELSDKLAVRIGGAYREFASRDATDFCIYNEVIMEHWGARREIYGYPKHVFPPTFDHTATLAGDSIFIIGGLGYCDLMRTSEIQIFRLDLSTFEIEQIAADGDNPGLLFRHGAVFDGDGKIVMIGGFSLADPESDPAANENMFELDVRAKRWRRLDSSDGCFLGISMEDYKAMRAPRYGTSNPEKVSMPLWEHIIRNDLSGYTARRQFGDWEYASGRPYPGNSNYRELPVGPVWSWDRFGRSETVLKNGKKVFIGGEYEDAYDSDFCIYNDVVIEHPDGRIEIFIYPKKIFPPTDFHSATLIGKDIMIIGSTGYMDMRKPGKTQVFRLDTDTAEISPVKTSGDEPGWISRHSVEYVGGESILILGGSILQSDDQGFVPNTKMFELAIDGWEWRHVPPGDTRFFAVTLDEYQKGKLARCGTANPEAIRNPFWLEMARRKWQPSRARQQFDDPGNNADGSHQTAASRKPRNIDGAIWSAIREQSGELKLEDGRQFLIGGDISNYSDERNDAWIYNDIIVTIPDGVVEIYAYPPDLFPLMSGLAALETEGRVFIFGRGWHEGEFAHMPMAFALDPESFEVRLLDRTGTIKPAVITEEPKVEDNRILFSIRKKTSDDPDRFIEFCLDRLRWQDI